MRAVGNHSDQQLIGLWQQIRALDQEIRRIVDWRESLRDQVKAPVEICEERGLALSDWELICRFGKDAPHYISASNHYHRRQLAVDDSEEFARRDAVEREAGGRYSRAIEKIISTPAEGIIGMLAKLRLLIDVWDRDGLDDAPPALAEAYDPERIPDLGWRTAPLISIWADAEQLAIDVGDRLEEGRT